MRMDETPASPPKNPERCGASACSNSASARVIMEKYTPLRWVENQPAATPEQESGASAGQRQQRRRQNCAAPATPMACIVANAPMPKYAE